MDKYYRAKQQDSILEEEKVNNKHVDIMLLKERVEIYISNHQGRSITVKSILDGITSNDKHEDINKAKY